MISWLRNQFPAPKPPPDHPNALIPGWVIDSFPLLSRMPQLIGLDLRNLTADKFRPQEIPFLDQVDGLKYEGVAMVHNNYGIVCQSGNSPMFNRPYWYLAVVCMNTDLPYLLALSERLNQVYDSVPANRITKLHLEVAEVSINSLLSTWKEAHFLPNEGRHMYCRLMYQSLEYSKHAILRYQIGGDVV